MNNDFFSNLWLIVYLLAWIIFFYYYQKKRKIYDAGSFILTTYVVYAVCSLLLYNSAEYNAMPLHLFPFIYLFLMFLLSMSTVLKYDVTKISRIQRPNQFFFTVVALFFLLPSLINAPSTISHIQEGIAKMVVDSRAGNEMYQESTERSFDSGTGGISNIMAIFSSAFYNIGVLFTFYYLTLDNRKKWLSIALILSTLIGLLVFVSLGQRSGVVLRLLTIISTYFVLKSFYSQKTRKVLNIAGTTLVVLVTIPVILITVSRFGADKRSPYDSTLSYVGQANINFNKYGLDDNGIRYGDRTVPLFKKMLGFSNVPDNYWKRREKYPHLKMDDDVFYTFVGDFTIDFGPIIAFILFILFTPIFNFAGRIRGDTIKFHQLLLIHFVMCVCVQGGMYLFSFSDTAGNLQLIVFVIAYCVFKIDYDTSKTRLA